MIQVDLLTGRPESSPKGRHPGPKTGFSAPTEVILLSCIRSRWLDLLRR